MHTQLISDESEFVALQPEWDAVLSASNQDVPFLRHEWLVQWWRAFGCGELAIVTCRDDDTGVLLGVLPAYRSCVGVVWPVRTLRLLGDGRCGGSALGAFAIRTAEEPVLERLVAAALDDFGSWEALELRYVRLEDTFARIALAHLGSHVPRATVSLKANLFARPCIDLHGSWDEYLARSLSPERRRRVRNALRRAQRAGATTERITTEEALETSLDDAIEIHELRMREVVSPQFVVTVAQRQFWHATCRSLLAEDRLRLSFLVVEGQRVGCSCQMRYRDTRYAMWGGFLGDWARIQPPKVLFCSHVQDAIAEGCVLLDYGLGEVAYKSSWGAVRADRFGTLRAYRATLHGQLARVRGATVIAAQQAIDAAPERLRQPLWNLAQVARGLLRSR